MRGLQRASAEWVFQLDSDGQFVVAEFPLLWEQRHEADLVLGVRAQRRDPAHRLLLTRAVRLAASLLAGSRIQDVNTPFRLLRRSLWSELEPHIPAETLAPNILVALGAAVRNRPIEYVPVTHLARKRGTSTLRALRLVRFSLRGLGQLLAFRYHLARASAPTGVPAGGTG
jgi:glycosyltransferase involved in cell wall biosynthesis